MKDAMESYGLEFRLEKVRHSRYVCEGYGKTEERRPIKIKEEGLNPKTIMECTYM
jgi:hypothetical protein